MDLKNKYFGKTKEEAAKKKIDIKKTSKFSMLSSSLSVMK